MKLNLRDKVVLFVVFVFHSLEGSWPMKWPCSQMQENEIISMSHRVQSPYTIDLSNKRSNGVKD